MRRLFRDFLITVTLLSASAATLAQSSFTKQELDQMLAPVALYPDALLSQLLMASTYPEDVAAAAAWSSKNTTLSGDAAVKAVQDQPWDPSVMSLAGFPSVLDMMGRQPDWVRSVGDAFLDQPEDVMSSVQRLRTQAKNAGTLQTNAQQKVSTQEAGGNTIVTIEPASPTVVYVPTYNPTTAYGTWAYPSYPPAYYPPPVGSAFASAMVSGLAWGTGIAIADSLWGGFDWGHNDVDIDVNRYNNINVNRRIDASRGNVNWNHDPARRGNAPYRNTATQQRFDSQRNAGATRPGQSASRGAGGQQARREHAQQVMHQRAPAAGRSAGAGSGQGAAARGAATPRGDAGRHNAQRDNAVRSTAAGHGSARNAAVERSRTANRDNALRGVNSPSPARHAASRPANRPAVHSQPHRPSPGAGARSGGRSGGAHINRGHGRR
ncbi:DUF3300 domain-containing protein [Achromobacter insolitus]|uniref:DUF3300 domain-containing protein n=1 Tax=Achromobacter insolitus TaxID=217204 RepID=UPI00174D4EC9|nr:DUF3300 domain-containing protein [Achromobacter insolitus]